MEKDIDDEYTSWIVAAHFCPSDEFNVLVSCWDHSSERYCGPILAYWDDERDNFYDVNPIYPFPLKVDIWRRIPKLPDKYVVV
jgi:hypothetical protein